MSKKTINIRVYETTRNRLKVKAAKKKTTIIKLIDELSKYEKHTS